MFLKKHFPQYAAACPGFVGLKWPMPSPAPRGHTVWQHLRLQPQGLPSALIQWHNGYTHPPAAHRHGPRFYLAATLTYHTEFEAFGFSAKLQNPRALTATELKGTAYRTSTRKRKKFWRCDHLRRITNHTKRHIFIESRYTASRISIIHPEKKNPKETIK